MTIYDCNDNCSDDCCTNTDCNDDDYWWRVMTVGTTAVWTVLNNVLMTTVMTSDDWNEYWRNLSYCLGNYLKHKINTGKSSSLAGQPITGLVVLLLRRSESNHSTAQYRDGNVRSEFGRVLLDRPIAKQCSGHQNLCNFSYWTAPVLDR